MLDGIAPMRAGDALRQFEALPSCGLEALLPGGPALVLAPHADDESLGCGGLIAEACAQGRPPVVAILTDGVGSHPNTPPARLRALREREAAAATGLLGLPRDRLHFLGLPDTAAPLAGPGFERAVAELARLFRHGGCGVVVAPWRHDPHCDHEAAAAMAIALARAEGVRLLSYPVWGWTLPLDAVLPRAAVDGWRLDISAHLAAKRRAIAAHASQHGGLVDDDPGGFQLPPGLLAVFERPYEVFLDTPW